jgi:hypothetical protein
MNVSIVFEEQPKQVSEVLKRTASLGGREYDITKRLESLMVRLGPYDNSDYIEIKCDPDTGEVMVLTETLEGTECVFSQLEEQV